MLTHIDEKNRPRMVDVGAKDITERAATAQGKIKMSKDAYNAVIHASGKKGPVLQTAVVAAVMGAKKTSELIPMCHPLAITAVDTDVACDDSACEITLSATVRTRGRTGVEMEALSAVSIGLLTIYDMVKAVDKAMTISDICLISKSGGKSGEFKRQ